MTTNDIAGLVRKREPNENDKRTARLTMKLLREQGLVNRLPYFDVDQERGGITYVYGLSDKALQSTEGKTFDEHSERTLDHELAISYFHLSLKQFCEANQIKLKWQQSDLKCGIAPDSYFSLTFPDRGTFHFFLEMERAKIGNFKDGRSSLARKLEKYHLYYDSDKCQKEWGFKKFRVVLIRPTAEKAENLLAELSKTMSHRMFWVTDEANQMIFRTPKDYQAMGYTFLDI